MIISIYDVRLALKLHGSLMRVEIKKMQRELLSMLEKRPKNDYTYT